MQWRYFHTQSWTGLHNFGCVQYFDLGTSSLLSPGIWCSFIVVWKLHALESMQFISDDSMLLILKLLRGHGLSACECGRHACFDMTVVTVFGFREFHAGGNCCVIWRWCGFGNAVQIWWHLFTDTYITLPTFDACLVLKSFSSSSFTIMFNPPFPFLHCRCVCQCLKVLNAYAPCRSRAILWFFCALQVSASLFIEGIGCMC
jgi:hypothetical protein